jgi:hypothetical protein
MDPFAYEPFDHHSKPGEMARGLGFATPVLEIPKKDLIEGYGNSGSRHENILT